MRPRAKVTHFFKLWIPYDNLWLVGKTGENQVRGIQEALPPLWKHKVDGIHEEYHLESRAAGIVYKSEPRAREPGI